MRINLLESRHWALQESGRTMVYSIDDVRIGPYLHDEATRRSLHEPEWQPEDATRGDRRSPKSLSHPAPAITAASRARA